MRFELGFIEAVAAEVHLFSDGRFPDVPGFAAGNLSLEYHRVGRPGAGPGIALSFILVAIACSFAALCYAELATTYTRAGGDYEYLTCAFGPWAGFLFGWAQLTAVLTSSIGTMAYTFADYGVKFV